MTVSQLTDSSLETTMRVVILRSQLLYLQRKNQRLQQPLLQQQLLQQLILALFVIYMRPAACRNMALQSVHAMKGSLEMDSRVLKILQLLLRQQQPQQQLQLPQQLQQLNLLVKRMDLEAFLTQLKMLEML